MSGRVRRKDVVVMKTILNKDKEEVGFYMEGVNVGSAKELAKKALEVVHGKQPRGGYPATASELLTHMAHTFGKCVELAGEKNARYAKSGDPFKNLSRGGGFGIAVRLDDKVSRLLTLTSPDCTVSELDESIEDTCRDLINYAALLLAMRAHQGGDK